MRITDRIRNALLKFRGRKTNQEAAEKLGVSRRTFENWISKKPPGKWASMMLIEKLHLNKQIRRVK